MILARKSTTILLYSKIYQGKIILDRNYH